MAERAIEIENRYLAKTYWKRPVVLTRGRGALVWDSEGRCYIDCMAGYGVAILGHCHPRVIEAVKRQAEELGICHGSFYTEARAAFVERLAGLLPDELTCFVLCNSGAEAVEVALKLSRKSTGRKDIVAAIRGYHGKTMGALSATWEESYRRGFEPLVPNFKHIPFGSLECASKAVTRETAALIVEPIQGEGGVRIAPDGYLQGLREICDEKGALLVFDEIQTGLGRTGKMFAFEHWGVVPDAICLGKGIGGGIPMGVTATSKELADCLGVGGHTSTFGGNPLACAAGSAVLDVLAEERLPQRAESLGSWFKSQLEGIVRDLPVAREARGLGLMLGLELRFRCGGAILKALDRGVILLEAGLNVIRFLPPLVIEQEQLRRVAEVLREVLQES